MVLICSKNIFPFSEGHIYFILKVMKISHSQLLPINFVEMLANINGFSINKLFPFVSFARDSGELKDAILLKVSSKYNTFIDTHDKKVKESKKKAPFPSFASTILYFCVMMDIISGKINSVGKYVFRS